MLNTPNVITIIRILLVPTYMFFMYRSDIQYNNQLACLFFVVAALTDLLDGYIARKYKLITNLGKVLDPVADKIMVAAAMIVLIDISGLPAWILIVMLFRDFSVGALRDIAAQQGTIIAAGFWGKMKTAFQMTALGFLIFKDSLSIWPISAFGIEQGVTVNHTMVTLPVFCIGMILIYLALFTSILSGIIYFIQFRKLVAKG